MENNILFEKINTAYEELIQKLGSEAVKKDEPMKSHITFRVGGNADLYIKPETAEDIDFTVKCLKKNNIEFFIIGNGSNLIVQDKGIRGAVIQIYDNFSDVDVDGDVIYAKGGTLLSKVASIAMDNGLGGREFASGIPGSIGGAVYMNAGAYGGEMKDIVVSVDILDENGNILTLSKDDMDFSYRKSIICNSKKIILGCKLKLYTDEKENIKSKMSELSKQRKEKQPLEFPSAGSTFKRPEGYFAGKLISDADLKGYSIGGAQVSEKHAGFIINKGNATSKDILDLIEHCQKVVFEKFGVKLEPEVKIIGER